MRQSYRPPLPARQSRALNAGTFAGLPMKTHEASNSGVRAFCFGAGLVTALVLNGQITDSSQVLQLKRSRFLGTTIGGGGVIAGTLISLDQAWYSQYDRSSFHVFDDGAEWLQLDKVGHGYATYTVGRWGHGLLRWCGVRERTAVWAGGSLGLVYLSAVEMMDGHSEAWGFSPWDMVANAAGTGLFIGQQLGWREQRIKVKYSAHLTPFALQRPELLGESLSERILKDYNGCTYWLSTTPHAFGAKGIPAWLGVAVGYGGEGMLNADPRPGQYRQFYLSLDVDLERLPVKGKFWRTVLFTLNCVKVPMPALELDGRGRSRGHALYF